MRWPKESNSLKSWLPLNAASTTPRQAALGRLALSLKSLTGAFGYHEGMIRAINAITIAGGIVLLVMSLWPGYAGGCLLLLALPLIAMLGLAWLIVVALAASQAK